jgi:hypothetical protein
VVWREGSRTDEVVGSERRRRGARKAMLMERRFRKMLEIGVWWCVVQCGYTRRGKIQRGCHSRNVNRNSRRRPLCCINESKARPYARVRQFEFFDLIPPALYAFEDTDRKDIGIMVMYASRKENAFETSSTCWISRPIAPVKYGGMRNAISPTCVSATSRRTCVHPHRG